MFVFEYANDHKTRLIFCFGRKLQKHGVIPEELRLFKINTVLGAIRFTFGSVEFKSKHGVEIILRQNALRRPFLRGLPYSCASLRGLPGGPPSGIQLARGSGCWVASVFEVAGVLLEGLRSAGLRLKQCTICWNGRRQCAIDQQQSPASHNDPRPSCFLIHQAHQQPARGDFATKHTMSKAFTKESDDAPDDDDDVRMAPLPGGGKNYITGAGYARLRGELMDLIDVERPKIVDVVHWAASNGDRSENGDYIYGKKRLREIDRRIRFLTGRLEIAVVTDPSLHHGNDQIFFGATVTYVDGVGAERTVTILGIDEVDNLKGEISWVSPVARTLLKAREGDVVELVTPQGRDDIEVLRVRYPAPPA